MLILFLTFTGLAAVIIVAAMFLARYADRIADQTGLGGSVTGLVLLAGATSLPEFSIGMNAVTMGAVDLTAGDVLGSSLINLLILAMMDLVSRNTDRILSKTAAAHALSAIVACMLTGIVLLGIVLDCPWSVMRLGPVSWALLITYFLCARLLFLDQKTAARSSVEGDRSGLREADLIEASQDPKERTPGRLPHNIGAFIAAAAVIFFVAPRLAHTADTLAAETGLGRTFFGTLFVAVMTSLPEGVSTFYAIRMGTTDMAIGNILGSNAFNMVILAAVDLASPVPVLSMVSNTHCITAACVIITTCATMLSLLYRAEKRWWIIEPDAALVLLLVIGSLWLVYSNG
ncbi:MAG: hypothetical protein KDA91_01875 [Planctomycetaceae bacterium]|nr:hypothetical protein [Planctomycetaceae bacterium]